MTTQTMQRPNGPILSLSDLSVEYRTSIEDVLALGNVSLEIQPGTIYGVVGESGSGKSTLAMSALGWTTNILNRTGGSSQIDGKNLFDLTPKELRRAWGNSIGYVPQEIGGALHPSYRIRTQFRESLKLNRGMSSEASDARAIELLDAAGLPDPKGALQKFPHQFSGGQLQRIAIALALAPHPELLVLDEPTTGLDVTTQQKVAGVLRDLVAAQNVAALFISHDIALLSEYADVIVVMYAGEIIEVGPSAEILSKPRHPYTRALVDAVPSADEASVPVGIPGLPPGRVVHGKCSFAPRCKFARDICVADKPALLDIGVEHSVRCARVDELQLLKSEATSRPARQAESDVVIEVKDVSCTYRSQGIVTNAVKSASLKLRAGSVAALVGESGSGKSTLGQAISGVRAASSGTIYLDGQVLPVNPKDRTDAQRKDLQLIFQNTGGSLNPRRRVGSHLQHIASKYHKGGRQEQKKAIDEVLAAVQLSPALLDRFPQELSGGQKQRVAIASAFLARPRVVICDEITSGQDVSVQAAILETLAELQHNYGTAVLFISHDLGVVRAISDHVYVLRQGELVESGPTEEVFSAPKHVYTKELLNAVPTIGPKQR